MDEPQFIVRIDHSNDPDDSNVVRQPEITYQQNPTPISEVLIKLFPNSILKPEVIKQNTQPSKLPSSQHVKTIKNSLIFQQLKTTKQIGFRLPASPKTKLSTKLDPLISYWRNIYQLSVYNKAVTVGVYLAVSIFILGLFFQIIF